MARLTPSNGLMDETPVWTARELRRLGLTNEQVRAKVAGGELVRLRRGVYRMPDDVPPEALHRRLIAATAPVVDPTNVFSHTSAAILHGLPVPRNTLGVATMLRRTPGHGNGETNLRVRNTKLAGDQVTEVEGHQVTTLVRTVCDQARLLPFEWGVATADAAMHRGVARAELQAELARFPRLFGVAQARQVLSFADERAESPGESLTRVQMARYGLPEPELQFEVFDEEGEFVARCDFGWPEQGLVGEMDGEQKYGALLKPNEKPSHVIMREKRREQRLRQLGWWYISWGWLEANDGSKLNALVRDGLRNALLRSA